MPKGFSTPIETSATKPSGPFALDLSEKYQPNYVHPPQYSRSEMKQMVREAVSKIERNSGRYFNRLDPQQVWHAAEFFWLMSREDLDLYLTPMEEADIRYFAEITK